jgi:hypothetical protein
LIPERIHWNAGRKKKHARLLVSRENGAEFKEIELPGKESRYKRKQWTS